MLRSRRLAALCSLLLLAGAVWCALPTKYDDAVSNAVGPNVNVSTILSAVGTPYCMRRCLGRLAYSAKRLLAFNETAERFHDLCTALASTKECLDKRSLCGPRHVYDAVTSGMEYTCVTKRASFDRVEPCLKLHLDSILKTCDSSCALRANLSALSTSPTLQMAASMNGNLLMVAKQLPPFCSGVLCSLPCIVDRTNAVCPISGWLILDAVLQPFDKAAALFDKAPELVRQASSDLRTLLVREQLSTVCEPLFDVSKLAQMRKGKF